MRRFTEETHYDLFATYTDGTYHSSEWPTLDDAKSQFARLLCYGVSTAIIWKVIDQIDHHEDIVRALRCDRMFEVDHVIA